MGRMKEKFLDEQQRKDAEMQNQYIDDDYCCNEECGCHEENKANNNAAEYDAWWNSLTDSQKEQLFEDRDASEKEAINKIIRDNDFLGPNANLGV
jgi:hypothetical protein